MLQAGVLWSLASALILGIYLFVYKHSFSDLPSPVYVVTIELSGMVWYALIAIVTWPAGEAVVPAAFDTADVLLLAGIYLAIAAANLVSIQALKLGDVSYVAPLNKLAPAFVLPLEIVWLTITPTALQTLGLVLAVVAIYLANYEGGGFTTPFRRAAGYTPARLALLGAMLFALADVGTRALLSGTAITPQAFALLSFAAVGTAALPIALRRVRWERLRPATPRIFALAGFFAVGVHLKTIAFDVAAASIVSPIVNMQAVVAVLLGGLLLGERGLPRRLAAAVVAVSGVALIAAG